jgi:hypothetical protein
MASIVGGGGGGEFHPGAAAAELSRGQPPYDDGGLPYLEDEDDDGEGGGGGGSKALWTKNEQADDYGGRTGPSPCRKPDGHHWSRLGCGRGSSAVEGVGGRGGGG